MQKLEYLLNKIHTFGSFSLFLVAFPGMLKFFDVIK